MASFWLNAAAAAEVHALLKRTKALRDYHPPSHRTVLARCLSIYVLCAVVATWHLWWFIPVKASPMHGLACLADDHDRDSTFFFWLAYLPTIAGIPVFYAAYVAVDCWRKGLLNLSFSPTKTKGHASRRVSAAPPESSLQDDGVTTMEELQHQMLVRRSRQARQLSLYFGRIFLAIVVMWVPATILFLIYPMRSGWGVWVGGTWAHFQGVVSAMICLTKPDIKEAVLGLVPCRRSRGEEGSTWTSARISDLSSAKKKRGDTKLGDTNTSAEESQGACNVCVVGSLRHSGVEHVSEFPEASNSGGHDHRPDVSE
jgi:hypothetical protein